MAAARQDLAVDQCPTMESIMEYAKYAQAEAEDLALVMGSSKASTTSLNTNTAPAIGSEGGSVQFGGVHGGEAKGSVQVLGLNSWL